MGAVKRSHALRYILLYSWDVAARNCVQEPFLILLKSSFFFMLEVAGF